VEGLSIFYKSISVSIQKYAYSSYWRQISELISIWLPLNVNPPPPIPSPKWGGCLAQCQWIIRLPADVMYKCPVYAAFKFSALHHIFFYVSVTVYRDSEQVPWAIFLSTLLTLFRPALLVPHNFSSACFSFLSGTLQTIFTLLCAWFYNVLFPL
jgi:hypothetical protein